MGSHSSPGLSRIHQLLQVGLKVVAIFLPKVQSAGNIGVADYMSGGTLSSFIVAFLSMFFALVRGEEPLWCVVFRNTNSIQGFTFRSQ